jgi:excisionase family DNA binding protein
MWNTHGDDSDATTKLLTIAEVAQLLQVPRSWVYSRTRRRSADRIPGFRLGKYWRFREADVLAWLEQKKSERAYA